MIAHDFNLPYIMYRLPKDVLQKIKIYDDIEDYQKIKDKERIKIFWGNRLTTKDIQDMPNLEFIQLGCAGTELIDLNEIDKKIRISKSSTILAPNVASHAVALMYTLGRRIHESIELKRYGKNSRDNFNNLDLIKNIYDSKVLVLGTGNIAKCIKAILNKSNLDFINPAKQLIFNDDLCDLDFLVCCMPHLKETENLINKEFMMRLPKNCYIINVGRGSIINEEDLLYMVESEQIAGAGLDVVSDEPISPENPLYRTKNIVITPHIAAYNKNYWALETSRFLQNLLRLKENKTLIEEVDKW